MLLQSLYTFATSSIFRSTTSHTTCIYIVARFCLPKSHYTNSVVRKFLICTAGKPLSAWFGSIMHCSTIRVVCAAVENTGNIPFILWNHKRLKRLIGFWFIVFAFVELFSPFLHNFRSVNSIHEWTKLWNSYV